MPDLDEQIRELVNGVAPVTAGEVIAEHQSSMKPAIGRTRYGRPRRMNTYAIGAAAMATAICVLVVVLVLGVSSSPKPRVVTPARPSFVPASWQRVTFGGLSMYAPGYWPVGSEQSWGSCGPSHQPFFKDDSVELDTGANAVEYHCPSISPNETVPPVNGLLIDPGPYGPLPDVGFTKRLHINGLWIDPATTNGGGMLVLAVSIPGRARPVAVEIGLAGGGKVAHTIEYSMRLSASNVSQTTPTTIPVSERAKPCANGMVSVKQGPPTDFMSEMLDIAATVEFVTSSPQECTIKGLPRYFDQLANGQLIALVVKDSNFSTGTTPISPPVPVLLSGDKVGYESFKFADMTVAGPITCSGPGKLAIQAPGQSAHTEVPDFDGLVCPSDAVFAQPLSASDPFYDADHHSP